MAMAGDHQQYAPQVLPAGKPVGQYYAPPSTGLQAMSIQGQEPVAWSTGLCDCFDDCGLCCITWCCPCITFGQIAEIVDRGASSCGSSGAMYGLIMSLTGWQFIYSCSYRTKMRRQYALEEDPCNDCVVHWCCEPCALCQEYRELRNRGFDMKIGWYGNVERQQQLAVLPPSVHPGMAR